MPISIRSLVAALAVIISAAPALAQTRTQATIPYQGRLDNGGAPYSGTADISVTLWSAPVAGGQLSPTVDFPQVFVEDGLFFIEIPFDSASTGADPFWIELEVAGVTLSPRQAYRPAVSAVQAAGAEVTSVGSVVFMRSVSPETTAASLVPEDTSPALPTVWQSFTAGRSGPLANIAVAGALALGDTYRFRIYEGEGTGGSLLLEADGTYQPGEFDLFDIANGPQLLAGLVYTFEIAVIDGGTQLPGGAEWPIVTGDSYAGGRASTGPSDDLRFIIEILGFGSATAEVEGNGSMELSGQLRVSGADSRYGDAVDVPDDSISRNETSDEPGVASERTLTNGAITSSVLEVIADRSISVPNSGYVVAMFNAEFEVTHVNGNVSSYTIGLSNSATQLPLSQDFEFYRTSATPSGLIDQPYSVHGVFRVSDEGSYTVYALGRKGSTNTPDGQFNDIRLTLMYFPSSYGVVDTDGTLFLDADPAITDTNVFPPSDEHAAQDPIIQAELEESLQQQGSPD